MSELWLKCQTNGERWGSYLETLYFRRWKQNLYGAESYASQSIDRVTQRVGLRVPRRHIARGKEEIYGHVILFQLNLSGKQSICLLEGLRSLTK